VAADACTCRTLVLMQSFSTAASDCAGFSNQCSQTPASVKWQTVSRLCHRLRAAAQQLCNCATAIDLLIYALFTSYMLTLQYQGLNYTGSTGGLHNMMSQVVLNQCNCCSVHALTCATYHAQVVTLVQLCCVAAAAAADTTLPSH
jgi:hypothetical protein